MAVWQDKMSDVEAAVPWHHLNVEGYMACIMTAFGCPLSEPRTCSSTQITHRANCVVMTWHFLQFQPSRQ
jgi:hypothetical protein